MSYEERPTKCRLCMFICSLLSHYHCRFEELLHDERVITQELIASEKKFESWSRLPAAAVESTRAVKKATKQSSSLPPAIAAFEVKIIHIQLAFISSTSSVPIVHVTNCYFFLLAFPSANWWSSGRLGWLWSSGVSQNETTQQNKGKVINMWATVIHLM